MVTGENLGTGTSFLLDTGIIIRYLKGNPRATELLDHLEEKGSVRTSVITVTEVAGGYRPGEEDAGARFFERVLPIDVNVTVAFKAGSLKRHYPELFGPEVRGGTADALIAATASEHNCTLVTLNKRHFAPVSGLQVRALDEDSPSWV